MPEEVKKTDPSEIKSLIEAQGKAFDEFKTANDKRLEEIEKRGSADAVTEEKVAKLNDELSGITKQLEDLQTKTSRPAMETGEKKSEAVIEHKAGFNGYLRKGAEGGLVELEQKALSVGTDSAGGFAVPEELDRDISDLLIEVSPFRSVANVVTVGSAEYKKLVNQRGTASGWVGETAARAETDTSTFAQVQPPLGEIFANPAATQTMLDDAFFNVEQFIANEVATEFAKQEGIAFIAGDGINKPKGFLDEPQAATADGVRAFGTLQYVPTGVAGDWPASNPSDILLDLVHTLRTGYRQNAVWMLNTLTLAAIRKFKDGDGDYLWRPGLQEGQPSTLLGFPVAEAVDMPSITADAVPLAFGDFRQGYTIVDRFGTRVLRDPFSNKPFVHFYTTKRVGGKVMNSEAIKLLKFSTS